MQKKLLKKITPIQYLVIGYVMIVLLSAALLTLPFASKQGTSLSYIDAVFTTSSAISTTGLTVVDTGGYFSLFGQIIILIVFQIGGLGYMTFFVFIAYFLGNRLNLVNRIVARESLFGSSFGNIYSFFKSVLLYTVFFELVGALILSIFWMRYYSAPFSIYLGIFHSISAFCTAGFSVFSENLLRYNNSIVINIVIPILSLAGGIGFFVLSDLYNRFKDPLSPHRKSKHMSVHSKLAISVTSIVILCSSVIMFFSEKTLHNLPVIHRFLCSLFQCISASTTTGYNTIDISTLNITTLFILIVLMFIGASPGSTGGGIKTTTLGIIWKFLISHLLNKKDVDVFQRRITNNTINRAFAILIWFLIVIVVDIMILSLIEKVNFIQLLFEIVSALGNAGLSTGITSSLSSLGKIILSITMFIGRVGPLTIGFSLIGKTKTTSYHYAEGEVFVG